MERRNYLLTQAKEVTLSLMPKPWLYNENLQLNTIVNENIEIIPVCLTSAAITGSKTEALPGDDDPDPDTEYCY